MQKIHLLAEELINKIAAGEVIERPASVVKELVENSLDAGATKIIVELEKSGTCLIRISDNGEGMHPEDAQKSLLRHATSKISSSEDLWNLHTLGFRGEALASIAAVSQLLLMTKTADVLEGYALAAEGGKIKSTGICAAEQGTTLEIKNLFFNTPARKKFLKTDAVELHHCVDVVSRYALIHPEVSFTLLHEGKTLLQAPATHDFRSTLAVVYGGSLVKELIEVSSSSAAGAGTGISTAGAGTGIKAETGIFLSGFVSTPYLVRNDTSQQSLFVNKRWVKSEEITAAVYEAYHSLLFVNKHPVFVLHLQVDPQQIDVNVHPHKLMIKFEQKELVQQVVKQAILNAFQQNNLFPTVKEEQQLAFRNSFISSLQNTTKNSQKYFFESSSQKTLQRTEEASELSATATAKIATAKINSPAATTVLEELRSLPQAEIYSKLPPIRLLGQIHKTFFAAETEGGFLLIDQHAAHERVVYEQYMAQFMKEEVAVQELLQGEVMDFSPADRVLVEKNLPLLQQFGFHLEIFGNNTFVVKTIPSVLGRTQSKEALYDILAKLQERNALKELQEEIVTRMACRAAVMAGEELTAERMKGILEELAHCKLPFTCPHGRPTMIKTDVEEMEKKFRRK